MIALLTREGAYLAKRSLLNENKTYAQSVREEVYFVKKRKKNRHTHTHIHKWDARNKKLNSIKNCLISQKKELYHKLEKLRTEQKKEALENVEKCRELEQVSRDAYDSMIDKKRQKGI